MVEVFINMVGQLWDKPDFTAELYMCLMYIFNSNKSFLSVFGNLCLYYGAESEVVTKTRGWTEVLSR